MNILVVSSYPPMICGIGAYAEQQVAALRRDGHVVDVFSPPQGDGDFTGDLTGGMRVLRLARFLWAYDQACIHFTPSFFYEPDSKQSRLFTTLAFLLLALAYRRKLHFLIHETEYAIGEEHRGISLRRGIDRWTFRFCGGVTFHSERERDAFAAYYGFDPANPKFEIRPHDRDFMRYCSMNREQARKTLGVDSKKKLFLCIGFIQPHKGYDRVARALRRVESPNAMLRIVGSVRIPWQPAIDYTHLLHDLVNQDPRAGFIETFPTNELFDTWIVAADYVVVPYHMIWSSGVAARAKIYGRPVIVSDSGGLREQMTEGSFCFSTDDELVEILNATSR